jgi:glutathione S-transferase
MQPHLELVSHDLCPYVQRAVIVAHELGIALQRTDIDLASKPDWFTAISPTGKVPLLRVRDPGGAQHILFESAAISEYLDEIASRHLMPGAPLQRARVRAWVEFASGTLAVISGLYSAQDAAAFEERREALRRRFVQIEAELAEPWFAGADFGLVDAAFAPVFRYLDALEAMLAKLSAWRSALATRPSIIAAVSPDNPQRLERYLRTRQSHLGRLLREGSDQDLTS